MDSTGDTCLAAGGGLGVEHRRSAPAARPTGRAGAAASSITATTPPSAWIASAAPAATTRASPTTRTPSSTAGSGRWGRGSSSTPASACGTGPRSSARGLWRQYFRYGVGRSRTVRRHPGSLRLRQFAVPAHLPMSALALLISPWWAGALAWPAAYAAALAGASLVLAVRHRSRCGLLAGPAAAIMHTAWAIGFLAGLFTPARAALAAGDGHPAVGRRRAARRWPDDRAADAAGLAGGRLAVHRALRRRPDRGAAGQRGAAHLGGAAHPAGRPPGDPQRIRRRLLLQAHRTNDLPARPRAHRRQGAGPRAGAGPAGGAGAGPPARRGALPVAGGAPRWTRWPSG